MPEFETIEIDEAVAACSGSGGALGHPRVYLNLEPGGRAECPYCSRTFVNKRLAAHADHGAAAATGGSLHEGRL
ncbi:MAG TPA: zinc-finger domain-containing protein [Stellaceae bacterium]|jgi:uncharacterized Zn-finger protein